MLTNKHAIVVFAIALLVGCSSSKPQKNELTAASPSTASQPASDDTLVAEEPTVPDALDSLLLLSGPPSTDVAHESFLRGLQALQEGQLQLAEMFYKRALANSPRNRFLAFQLAEILAAENASTEALVIAKAGVNYPGTGNSNEYHLLARLYRENNEIDSAKTYYRKALAANDQNLKALYEYSLLLESLQEYNELSRVFAMLLPLLDYPRPMIDKQLLLYRLAQNDSAMVDLLRTAYSVHNDPDYACLLADMLEMQGKNAEAQAAVVKALDAAPEDRDAWNTLVRLQLRAGQLEEARRSQLQLYTLDTTQNDVLQRLAMMEFDVGRLDSAAIYFRRLAAMDSTDHVAHFFLSHLYQIAGDSTSALQQIRTAIALRPEAIPYRNQLGLIYTMNGDYSRAHEIFDSTMTIGNPMPMTMQLKANAYIRESDRIATKELARSRALRLSALSWQRRSFALDSTAIDLRFELASNLERLDSTDASIAAFNALLKVRPDHHPSLNYLGYLLVDSKRDIARGALLINKALSFDPNNPAYLDSKGWALYRQGQSQDALSVFEGVEKLGLDDSVLWEHMAIVCQSLQLTERSQAYWRKVLAADPGNAAALKALGANP